MHRRQTVNFPLSKLAREKIANNIQVATGAPDRTMFCPHPICMSLPVLCANASTFADRCSRHSHACLPFPLPYVHQHFSRFCRRHRVSQRPSERAPLHGVRVVPSGVRHELPVLLHREAWPYGQPAGSPGWLDYLSACRRNLSSDVLLYPRMVCRLRNPSRKFQMS